jgi:thiamine transport system ATP-binding protein
VTLELERVVVRYGSIEALAGVDLAVADGERLTVLGPSGSGKSTLLRAVAGLEPLAGGRIAWDGRDLAGVPVHVRGVGLMFQDYVLFPHRDVEGNVSFGLRMRGDSPAAMRKRVAEVLEMVGLRGYDRRRPTELSGGEQQRVALARALAPAPRLLMLDEPLGALDRTLRTRLLGELADLFVALSLTIVYVTHDQEEALALGDRVAVMNEGRIEVVAPPEDLWRSPPSAFVARFLGFANVAPVMVDEDGRALTPWGPMDLGRGAAAGTHHLLIRPEGLRPDPDGAITAVVESRTFRGDHLLLRVAVAGAAPDAPALEVRADWPDPPHLGDAIRLGLTPGAVTVLP